MSGASQGPSNRPLARLQARARAPPLKPRFLRQLSGLVDLRVRSLRFSNDFLRNLPPGLLRLGLLRLFPGQLSAKGMDCLASRCPDLELLDLSDSGESVEPSWFAPLSPLTRLTGLILAGCTQVDDGCCLVLGQMTSLQLLVLDDCDL